MKNDGVSATLGVILMIAITIAIAGTVYLYVSQLLDSNESKIIEISGNVTRIEKIFDSDTNYNITFDYNESYIIHESAINWKLGKWYRVSLSWSDYLNCYYVKKYSYLIE